MRWRAAVRATTTFPANDVAEAVHDAIAAAPSGAGWLSDVLSSAATVTAGHGTTIAIAMATLSTAIGVSVMCNWYARVFLAVAIAISVGYWSIGQGLGGVFTGQATDVGTAPVMILIASILFARERATEPQRAPTRSEFWSAQGEPAAGRIHTSPSQLSETLSDTVAGERPTPFRALLGSCRARSRSARSSRRAGGLRRRRAART
jgi:hypothetical protein